MNICRQPTILQLVPIYSKKFCWLSCTNSLNSELLSQWKKSKGRVCSRLVSKVEFGWICNSVYVKFNVLIKKINRPGFWLKLPWNHCCEWSHFNMKHIRMRRSVFYKSRQQSLHLWILYVALMVGSVSSSFWASCLLIGCGLICISK